MVSRSLRVQANTPSISPPSRSSAMGIDLSILIASTVTPSDRTRSGTVETGMQDVIWNGASQPAQPRDGVRLQRLERRGEAASAAVSFIRGSFDAEEVGHDRPRGVLRLHRGTPDGAPDRGLRREIDWPVATISAAAVPGAEGDLVMLEATEPSLRWRRYTETVLQAAPSSTCAWSITLGALLADVPHTRPVAITGIARSAAGRPARAPPLELRGPTGIVGVLHHALADGVASRRASGPRCPTTWRLRPTRRWRWPWSARSRAPPGLLSTPASSSPRPRTTSAR